MMGLTDALYTLFLVKRPFWVTKIVKENVEFYVRGLVLGLPEVIMTYVIPSRLYIFNGPTPNRHHANAIAIEQAGTIPSEIPGPSTPFVDLKSPLR
jgi:hypothetical protein